MDAFRQFFRDAIDPVRALLPYPMCHFEYTGLFVVGFLVAAVLAHFVGWLCFSDNCEQFICQISLLCQF
jgi:hypothetical protein